MSLSSAPRDHVSERERMRERVKGYRVGCWANNMATGWDPRALKPGQFEPSIQLSGSPPAADGCPGSQLASIRGTLYSTRIVRASHVSSQVRVALTREHLA